MQAIIDENFAYYSDTMNWFIFNGFDDAVMPSQNGKIEYYEVFTRLDISSAITYEVIAEGVGHETDCRFTGVMMEFIRFGFLDNIGSF